MKKTAFSLLILPATLLVANGRYEKTVDYVNIEKFMGTWYVMAARPTMFENGAFNSIEQYDLDKDTGKIQITFTFNKDSFDGKLETIKQNATVINTDTNAFWKVSPFWPISFDYIVIHLEEDYSWTAVGVPNQDFLWIMTRDYNLDKSEVDQMVAKVASLGYSTENIRYIQHNYNQ
jgi:apolipoprotein D and lipocalin family protein